MSELWFSTHETRTVTVSDDQGSGASVVEVQIIGRRNELGADLDAVAENVRQYLVNTLGHSKSTVVKTTVNEETIAPKEDA